jgi:transposase-like protein
MALCVQQRAIGTRRQYSEKFKREAIRLANAPGNSMASVAKDLGVSRSLIGHWVRNAKASRYEVEPGKPLKSESQCEVEQLRRELVRVNMEREILNKGDRLPREGSDVRFVFIAKNRDVWPVRVLCSVLNVSARGFYEWLGRRPSHCAIAKTKLTGLIRQGFEASDRTYGSRRVWRNVVDSGEH